MLDKIYLEITNVCNLDCSFRHKSLWPRGFMTEREKSLFVIILLLFLIVIILLVNYP